MAQPTYSEHVLVLRKTKLGESDLILTMIAEDGRQVRAVAKGARKPRSTFASRLEQFSMSDVLLASGRNLDIVKEVRLIEAHSKLRTDFDASCNAAPVAELAARVTQADLPAEKLFALTCAAFSSISHAAPAQGSLLCAAALLKMLSFAGFRPMFSHCANCAASVLDTANGGFIDFSVEEGGVLCTDCALQAETLRLDAHVVRAAHALLHMTFSDAQACAPDARVLVPLFQMIQLWCRYFVGAKLKSLDFLIANSSW